jgi:hypothetical protein
MKTLAIFLSILTPLIIAGCYYDSEETLYPTLASACDTVDIKFASHIRPILASNCYSCHSNANAQTFGDGVTLENYDDVVVMYTKIYASITHQAGAKPMPKNSAQLSACAIRQFAIWKQNGAPQ